MTAEPEIVSRCCKAPVRKKLGLGFAGVTDTWACTSCGRIGCGNTLPAPGTFEKPLTERQFELVRAG